MTKLIFRSFLVVFMLVSASAAMATVTINGATTIGSASNSFTPSAKVGISITSTANSYAAGACHVSGTFEYGTVGGTGTTEDVSKIYSKAIPAQGTNTTCAPTSQTSATALQGSGWQ